MWLLRRTDRDDMGDYSHYVTTEGDWSPAKDDADCAEEATEYEMVRAALEVVERRTFSGWQHPCDEWTGETLTGRSWWAVLLRPDGTNDTWPVHAASILHVDSEREGWDWIDALPEPAWFVVPLGKTQQIDKRRLTVERHGFGPSYGACRTCGHLRERHAPSSGTEATS